MSGRSEFARLKTPLSMPCFLERMPFCRSGRDFLLLIFYLGVFAMLLFAWRLSQPLIFAGSPYEGWDECMGYTQAGPMSLELRFQNATYGSIEEFKFRVARFIYQHLDPVGKHLSPRRWSNNVLASYLDESAIFKKPLFDATYSRGILDRQPFIIARYVNIIGGLILASILGCFWVVRYRYQSLFLIAPLLWFFVSTGYLEEAVNVTPNAWNALLAIMVFVCLVDVVERRRAVGLYISAALVAFGANSKIDFLSLAAPVALTWIIADFEPGTPFRRWVRPALFCVVSFLAVLILTNPRLLYAMPLVVDEQYRLLSGVRFDIVNPGHSSLGYRGLQLVKELLTGCLGAPGSLAKLHSFRFASILALCLLLPLSVICSSELNTRRKVSILIVLGSFYLCLWLMPLLLAGDAYGRYFLSGSAVAMISVGYASRYLWRESGRLARSVALLVACLCVVFFLAQAKTLSASAAGVEQRLQDGLDQTVSRNQAVLEMIKLIESGKYSKQVIIDQHSYTDIHAFLEKGLPVTLINVFNYQQELGELAHTTNSVLGLYVQGKGMAPESWEGKWNDEECSLYEGYLNYLSGFKTIAKFGNHPALLLDWGPVDCTDEVVIFETKPAPALP
jgi:hypothetical protein